MKPIQKRLAVFNEVKFGFFVYATEDYERMKEYVRVSEYVDVVFTPRSDEETEDAMFKALDREEEAARAEYERKLASIEERRGVTEDRTGVA